MDYAQAQLIFATIERASSTDLVHDLFAKAIDYAHIRAEYTLADLAEKTAMEDRRTRAHNAFIDSCNILSRDMSISGEDNSWRRNLGNDRKTIGDFACYVHCTWAIRAR